MKNVVKFNQEGWLKPYIDMNTELKTNARNYVIFGVGNTSSSHNDNRKNNCLLLDKGPTDDINDSVSYPK